MNRKILPSILSANFAKLENDILKVQNAGIDSLHIDVMDGHFVPNISIGPMVLKSLKKRFPDIFYDVHLMITHPENYIEPFSNAGADLINFHIEIGEKVPGIIQEVRKLNKKVGITINPDTEVESLNNYFNKVDLILVMTVQPGFGGQSFIDKAALKIKKLSEIKKKNNYNFIIETDGGVNRQTIKIVYDYGTEWFVIGSAIFRKDISEEIKYYLNFLNSKSC